MYKVFVNDLPIILSTKKNIGKQYTTIPLKEVKFKKLIRKINDGSLLYVNLYHKNEEKLEQFLLKKLPVVFAGGGLVFNANYTWFQLSDGELGDLNFPQNIVRVVLQYRPAGKFNAALNYQWDQGYKSNNTRYVGRIDAKSLVDMTLGYQLSNVVKFELSATNLFNNEFRALPGFPRIGRIISGRLLFNFN